VKLLFDQNLSSRLPRLRADVYPGSSHVRDHGLASVDDADVWAFAGAHGFVIVSKDDDFRQRSLLLGHPPKVVWLRLGNCPTGQVESLLRWHTAKVAELVAELVADADKAILILP
jgi:predicted nuclease of predicted toxin-antitoxin system